MPSIEAVEQFKTIVQGLAREPEIRAEKGLPLDEILPPVSQVDDDLADLLGAMPTTETSEPPEDDPISSTLDDLFAAPVPDHTEDPPGPSLDDLLGPAPEDLFADPAPPEDFSFAEPEPEPETEAFPEALETLDDLEDLGSTEDFGGLDDFLSAGVPDQPVDQERRAREGVSPEDLDDAFFEAPSAPASLGEPEDDDFEFGEAMGDTDFPELAGFADTKEEDVEAFDAMKEADEFQLGDFESQFGITADDHTDVELLNPAQAVDLEAESGARALSFTEEEFLLIQRALGQLPLNLRLAVEELIGEKQVPFDDLDKVLGLLKTRATAKTLASVVGKILGRKISIPAGFEKGSGATLEAQQATLWYNLKTIMFPVLRVSALVSLGAAILVLLGWNFLLRPWKANELYDRGLASVRMNDGAQADELFAQAWYYWPVQDRFFQFAEAYQDTGDYDRARRKYLELLKPSVKAYRDEDKPLLDQQFGKPLAPLPEGLEGQALEERLTQKKAAADAFYAYVVRLLSVGTSGSDFEGEIPGEVILGNPDTKGILDYSQFETEFGFDGRRKDSHFRRADAILRPLLTQSPGSKAGLLRRADNFLAWSQALSSRENLDNANTVLSEYLRLYGYDSPVTWRFVRVFLLQDEETELLKMRDRIDVDKKLAMDGETMALLARWFIDRDETVSEKERVVPLTQRTIEEEYGIRPQPVELPEAPTAEELAERVAVTKANRAKIEALAPAEGGGGHSAPAAAAPAAGHSLVRSGAAAAPAGGGHGGGEAAASPSLEPPFKYPNSSQPYRPDYLDKVDSLILRAMDTYKSLPELHYQLSRLYRQTHSREDERRALAAADTYFQRLDPRKSRLNDRPAMRVATSNRIGEIFDEADEPLQAEKYYLDAQKSFESFRSLGLVTLDNESARLFRNLGNLYYRQTPGVDASGLGTSPGGWDQALTLFEAAEQGNWEEPAVTFRLGVIHYEKKDFDQAVTRFFLLDRPGNKGESSGRDNPNLLYAMGNALFRSGNFASAEGYYRELLALLRQQRTQIKDFDPAGRASHRALAQRLYETWNNLAAAEYRASTAFRAGSPEYREALLALTTARAQSQILGRDLYENKDELDITLLGEKELAAIRDNEARIVAQTRKEKGLVEANLQVLSMIESAPASRREALAQQLEIFARIPLELDQAEAP